MSRPVDNERPDEGFPCPMGCGETSYVGIGHACPHRRNNRRVKCDRPECPTCATSNRPRNPEGQS